MIKFLQLNKNEIKFMRLLYLESLPVFQDYYLELLVEQARFYIIKENAQSIGYVILSLENILLEFYMSDQHVTKGLDCFNKMRTEFSVSRVYCKSFDYLLLKCCLFYSLSFKIIGFMFRDIIDAPRFQLDGMISRVAVEADIPFLLQQKDGLFETKEELISCVKNENIIVFNKKDTLIGCGFLTRIHENWQYYDIGMWVHPDFRKQGYATRIISYLKYLCLDNGWTPLCGCAFDNEASQKTLEKNGFISKHVLIEFELK